MHSVREKKVTLLPTQIDDYNGRASLFVSLMYTYFWLSAVVCGFGAVSPLVTSITPVRCALAGTYLFLAVPFAETVLRFSSLGQVKALKKLQCLGNGKSGFFFFSEIHRSPD